MKTGRSHLDDVGDGAGERAPSLWGDQGRRAFVLRKLNSLAGVLPLGGFLAFHLWVNASALGGQAAYDEQVRRLERLPLRSVLEIFVIFLPLAFHASYGLLLVLRSRPNLRRYPHASNWMYVVQRATGIAALLFLGWHLLQYPLARCLGWLSTDAFFPALSAHLSSSWLGVPWAAIGYVLGTGACTFHLANGLSGFCVTWGITQSPRSRRRAAWVFGVVAFGLLLLSIATVFRFATGVPNLG